MKAKTITKRVLSVILCTVMLFSCWVFTAPSASAATAGKYNVSGYVEITDDLDNTDHFNLTVYCKKNNGYGDDNNITANTSGNIRNPSNSFTKNSFDGFPLSWSVSSKFGGGLTWRNVKFKVHITATNPNDSSKKYEYTSGEYEMKSSAFSSYNGSKSGDCSGKPYANDISAISGNGSVSVPTTATTAKATYTAGTVTDQYGVNWYQDATLSATSVPNGCSFENNVLSVPNSANRASDYTCKIKQSCGSASNEKTINIKTFNYTVIFNNWDNSLLKQQENVEYNSDATPPTDSSNPPRTRAADNLGTYTFSSWSGDGYQSLKGVQTKTNTAVYDCTKHNYTITFKNGDGGTASTYTRNWDQTLTVPASTTKSPDPQYTYTFAGWATQAGSSDDGSSTSRVTINNSTKVSDAVVGVSYPNNMSKTYYPWFSRVKNKYDVTFNYKNSNYEDATPVVREQLTYGDTPEVPSIPTTITTTDKIYTFTGWDVTINRL